MVIEDATTKALGQVERMLIKGTQHDQLWDAMKDALVEVRSITKKLQELQMETETDADPHSRR